jgi:hypothetical protein
MVLNLILVGLGIVGVAAANSVTKTVKDKIAIKKAKKAEQLRQVEEALILSYKITLYRE